MKERRVVVTGIGSLTPIGNNTKDYWIALKEGKSGAAPITHFNAENFKTKFACEVKNFDPKDYLDRKEARKLDKFTQYAMVVAEEAMKMSKIDREKINLEKAGVIWGSGIGGMTTFYNGCVDFGVGNGTPRFNPFFIPKLISDIPAGHISIKYNFKGPNFPYPAGYPNSHCESEFPRNFYKNDSISIIITSPVDTNNQVDPYVNTGNCVDFFVKIDNIYYLDSKNDTGGKLNFSGLASSPTAPYIAGLIANLMIEKKYRKFTPKQIKKLLVDNSLRNLVKDENGNMLVDQIGRDNHLIDSNFFID